MFATVAAVADLPEGQDTINVQGNIMKLVPSSTGTVDSHVVEVVDSSHKTLQFSLPRSAAAPDSVLIPTKDPVSLWFTVSVFFRWWFSTFNACSDGQQVLLAWMFRSP
jgi:hypothetical protein